METTLLYKFMPKTNAIVCFALLSNVNFESKPIVCKALTRVSQRIPPIDIEMIGFRQFPAKDTKIPAYSRQIL